MPARSKEPFQINNLRRQRHAMVSSAIASWHFKVREKARQDTQ